MDDQRDGDFEILDLGPVDDKGHEDAEADTAAQDGEAEHAAVIDLGEGAAATPPSPTLPSWQRWAIMVVVFAAGVAFGGYGWHARSEAVDAARANLTGVDIQGNGGLARAGLGSDRLRCHTRPRDSRGRVHLQ